MKILYAIQGTGNGHLARATEIIPILQEFGEVDILVSGIQSDIHLPFNVKYKFYGFSFIFGKKGGVDIWQTISKMNLFRLWKDIQKLPVKHYDLVIVDFEPISAWACKLRRKKSIGLSHQNAVLHADAPKPKKTDRLGRFILQNYAPTTIRYGFHFKNLDEQNFTPVIRSAIRNADVSDKGHYTVYLPAFSDEEINKILGPFDNIRWEVFSKHCKKGYQTGTISFSPVTMEGFNISFISCRGILCTAGFETPAEALFMGKKLCVVPMKRQYEQACNAAFLSRLGVMVIQDLFLERGKVKLWIESDQKIQIHYPFNFKEILRSIIVNYK